jgi:hypothetical protein
MQQPLLSSSWESGFGRDNATATACAKVEKKN